MHSLNFARTLRRGALLCLAAALAFWGRAAAQGQAAGASAPAPLSLADTTHQRCTTISDTSRSVPSAEQVRERVALRDSLARIGRQFGVAEPAGLLFVAVDTGTMRGSVRFLDANLPDTAVHLATRLVERYLAPLQPGRGFQMLVRIDGDYPAPAPGKRLCQPAPSNEDEVHRLMSLMEEHHPDADKQRQTTTAVLRLVVDRDGQVAFMNVEKPTGDEFYDRYLPDLARHMKFYPARLNGQPFDTRIRFNIAFDH